MRLLRSARRSPRRRGNRNQVCCCALTAETRQSSSGCRRRPDPAPRRRCRPGPAGALFRCRQSNNTTSGNRPRGEMQHEAVVAQDVGIGGDLDAAALRVRPVRVRSRGAPLQMAPGPTARCRRTGCRPPSGIRPRCTHLLGLGVDGGECHDLPQAGVRTRRGDRRFGVEVGVRQVDDGVRCIGGPGGRRRLETNQ